MLRRYRGSARWTPLSILRDVSRRSVWSNEVVAYPRVSSLARTQAIASGGLEDGEAVSAMGNEPAPQAPSRTRAPRIGCERIVDGLREREGSPECNRLEEKTAAVPRETAATTHAVRLRLEEQHHSQR